MKKIIICAAALTLGLVAVSADARVHHRTVSANAETAKLNQEQLSQNQEAQPTPPPAEAQGTAPDSTDMAATQPDTQNIIVAAPAHDAEETTKQPDTSPPSTGTPSVDTPYVTTTPASYTPSSGQ